MKIEGTFDGFGAPRITVTLINKKKESKEKEQGAEPKAKPAAGGYVIIERGQNTDIYSRNNHYDMRGEKYV